MPDPYNYILSSPDPLQTQLEAVKANATINAIRDAEANAANQKRRNEILNRELTSIAETKDPAAMLSFIIRNPSFADKFKDVYKEMDSAGKQAAIEDASPVLSALVSGNKATASRILQVKSDQYKAAGDEQKAAETLAASKAAESSPEVMLAYTAGHVAALMGPDKFAENYSKLLQTARDQSAAPAELSRKQSEAEKAAIDSKFAESKAVADLQKQFWDVNKIKNDINVSKLNTQIAAANSAAERVLDPLKKKEIETRIANLQMERDNKIKDRAAEGVDMMTTSSNLIDTASRILDAMVKKDEKGQPIFVNGKPVMSDTAENITGLINGSVGFSITDDANNLINDINTLGSQQFLNNAEKLKGSTTDADAKELKNGIRNLSRISGPDRLYDNIKQILDISLKARKNTQDKYGIPFSPAPSAGAQVTEKDLNDLISKYGQ